MKTIETKVYEFAELNNDAKYKAREWYREHALDYEWWDSTYEYAARIGLELTSFGLDRNQYAEGKFTEDAETVARNIFREHGETCETFKTAKAFLHDWKAVPEDRQGEVEDDFLKSLLDDYSVMLQHEYEYLLSNEAVDESIISNGYTFTDAGKRFG